MKRSSGKSDSKREHIETIFQKYSEPSELLQSFTNLSNTVIETSLNGQTKFLFEILQNADDAHEDPNKEIELMFILHGNYFNVQHNGKEFDYNDVQRICDYASQIATVKANDLSKTGYKGLGFKSLFNLSDTIYILSNGYSFRFDKSYWPDWQSKPWQVIPIWCQYDELPLHRNFPYNQSVNIILKIIDISELEKQIRELITKPDLLLFMHHINKISLNLNGEIHHLVRKSEKYGQFNKIDFIDNNQLRNSFLIKTYMCPVPYELKHQIQGASQFIYPTKIQNAKDVPITFAVRFDNTNKNISSIKGLLFCTQPTQLHVTLPYHLNSLFVLNLDRSQLHENEWNEFLLHMVGDLQLLLLRDFAETSSVKNSVINIFRRKIDHPFTRFHQAYLKGYLEKRGVIGWLPSHNNKHLLKLEEAWIDDIEFFKQNPNIRDSDICPYLVSYDLESLNSLSVSDDKVKRFGYKELFERFESRYFSQLTNSSYSYFINYIHQKLVTFPSTSQVISDFKNTPLLRAKNGKLMSVKNAIFEDKKNVIPDFLNLNPIDNDILPLTYDVVEWFFNLGATFFSPRQIIQESILKWIEAKSLHQQINLQNHVEMINYVAKNTNHLTVKDIEILKEGLLVLASDNQFKLAKTCYFPDAVPIKVFADIISKDETISSVYDVQNLKSFFKSVGVCESLSTADVIRKSILFWIEKGTIQNKITHLNYSNIIEFMAMQYHTLQRELAYYEISQLDKMLVLTQNQTFEQAHLCYFDSAIPTIKELQDAIPKSNLVSLEGLSDATSKLLSSIGVSKNIEPITVMRNTILKWISEGNVRLKITFENHHSIMNYIADNWNGLNHYYLNFMEEEQMKLIPILTKNNSFRKANQCYLSLDYCNNFDTECIPNLNSVISDDEFVSADYDSMKFKKFLLNLGVRDLSFINIYERYADHLNIKENVEWFFYKLNSYDYCGKLKKDSVLKYLRNKFASSPCLLTKSGKMHKSTDIYCSKFNSINYIVPDVIPLLEYDNLKKGLETWFQFKNKLELKCITQLLSSLENEEVFGSRDLRFLFSTILDQLKSQKESEIKKYEFKLFSKDYQLKPAKKLYYFKEEDATCELKSSYLKRIYGMSHEDTLELARLCGVNILPYKKEIIREGEELDDSLKEFYLERLPFIAIQEAKKRNEDPYNTLHRLYDSVRSIQLYRCQKIEVKYSFGTIHARDYFDGLKLFVFGNWMSKRTKIHKYMINKLGIIKNIDYIIDMDPSEDINEWLDFQREDRQKLDAIEEELKQLKFDDFLEDFEPDSTSQSVRHKKKGRSKSRSHGGKKNRIKPHSSNSQVSSLRSYKIPECSDGDQPPLKWLGEMCVYHFLQDHYKNKYPKCHTQISNGLFFLQQQSRKIKIFWLNERGDRDLPQGLVLEKDDDIKWLIKVQPTKISIGDSFSVNQSDFTRETGEADDDNELKCFEKHCLYNIIFPDVTPDGNLEEICRSYVLYKTVLHKSTIQKREM